MCFSGVDLHQRPWLVERSACPEAIASFARCNFDHLLFDVGFDYRMQGSAPVIVKRRYCCVF